MAAISSSTSQTATTLAQALAKLAIDEAAKAPATTISADQAAVKQFEKPDSPPSESSSSQSLSVQSSSAVDLSV